MSLIEWPSHFPANCPPVDAIDLEHTIFYLVEHDPPDQKDFLSAKERNTFAGKPECERASLSCGLTRSYIDQLKESVPRLRPMRVAESTLNSEHGKIKPTGKPGHHSVWLRAAALISATSIFRVVA